MPRYSRQRSSSSASASTSAPVRADDNRSVGGMDGADLTVVDTDHGHTNFHGHGHSTTKTITTTVDGRETAKQLLSSIMYMKDRSGRSFLHTRYQLSWSKALLDRAKGLDEHQECCCLLQRRFLLQQDEESGYTPLHRAVIESNLPAILLFLRHISNVDGTERFTQRPISVLHLADNNTTSSNSKGGGSGTNNHARNNGSNNLATLVANAVDHEGYTPLHLLGIMQRSELRDCRKALKACLPQVDVRAVRRLRPRQPNTGGNSNDHHSELQLDFFSENGDLLLPRDRVSDTASSDDDDGGTGDGEESGDDETDVRRRQALTGNSYACEVMTFGRGCALGVVSSSSSSSSSSSMATATSSTLSGSMKGGKDQPHYNTSTFFPQRVNAFAHEVVGRDRSAVMTAAATHHTLVALKNGHLYSFGLEKGGRLGLGDDQPQQCPLPRRIQGHLKRRHVVYVAAAENHSLCVTKDGHVFSWGSNRFGQLGDSISSGSTGGDYGSSTSSNRTTPRRIEDLKNLPCVAVAAGDRHSVALTRKGEVYVWGENSSGQLGVPRQTGIQKVQRVEALWNQKYPKIAIAITASEQSTLVLTAPAEGTHLNCMYEWGNGNHVPLRVQFERSRNDGGISDQSNRNRFGSSKYRTPNPVAIACAKYHNAAIDSDGLVYTWGLHAESLGMANANSKSIKHSNQRRNSMPQLVTGMLPEKGGGYAVKIAASSRHTAVITNTGALYTWGNTDSQSVLGHEGLRWQPNPRRVPGIHRAVAVAVAKEHTVLLIGASFPKTPQIVGEPATLELLSARKIVNHVDLFNVIPILVMAERTECNFLIRYCNDFISKNLDAVLCVGRKRDMNIYLNDMLSDTTYRPGRKYRDDHHHPLIFDILTAGNHWCVNDGARQWWSQSDGWIGSCVELSKEPLVKWLLELADIREYEEDRQSGLNTKNRRRTSSCNSDSGDSMQRSRSVSAASVLEMYSSNQVGATDQKDASFRETLDSDASTTRLAKQKHSSLSREIRSVRKKLKQIANLEARSVILTTNEKAKVSRRSSLESDLRLYETAVEEVERQIRKLAEEDSKLQARAADNPKTNIEADTSTPQKVTFADDDKSAKEQKGLDSSEAPLVIGPLEKGHFFCELCSVRCSDKSSFVLHQNGRKHRNRSIQVAEEEEKKTAADILGKKQAELLKQKSVPMPLRKTSAPKNAWSVLSTPTPSHGPPFKLPPPPYSVATEVARTPAPIPTKKTSWILGAGSKLARPSSGFQGNEAASAATHFPTILAEQSANGPPNPRTTAVKIASKTHSAYERHNHQQIWDSNPGSNRCVPLSVYSSDSGTGTLPQSDCITGGAASSRSSVSLADFLTPPKVSSKKKSKPSPKMAWSGPQQPSFSPIASPSNSLMQIVAQEADLREKQDKSYGKGGGSWYVERRQRADSILEIQQGAEEEQEYAQLIEEQKAIEAQIQDELKRQRQPQPQPQPQSGGSKTGKGGSDNGNNENKKQKKKRGGRGQNQNHIQSHSRNQQSGGTKKKGMNIRKPKGPSEKVQGQGQKSANPK